MVTLVDLYFEHINLYLPLLHRPTFERSINEGLHLRDARFGANVLLVCANGSRFSDDPRVLLDGEKSRHSSGWKWFDQVQMVKKSFLNPPTLYDLQFYSVSMSSHSTGLRRNVADYMMFFIIAFGTVFTGIFCSSGMLGDGWCWHQIGTGCGRPSEEKNGRWSDDCGG
jgi:hypothetical protein